MAASSSEGDSRSKKLSYERARREIISDKFRELGELLVEYGYQKGDVLTQADALTATIAVMRKLLNKDPPTSSPPESEDRGDLKRSRGSSVMLRPCVCPRSPCPPSALCSSRAPTPQPLMFL